MDNSKNQPISKMRQKEITQWLKAQRFVASKWIRLSALIGLLMSLLLILQAGILAWLLQQIIIEKTPPVALIYPLIGLFLVFVLRAVFLILREQTGQKIGHIVRQHVRQQVFNFFDKKGPASLQTKSAGQWSIVVIEQIDNLNDYYAKFLPQMQLAVSAPISMLIAVFWYNWAAGLILLFTAPLIPMFMAFVGMGAAEANRKNFQVLAQLSGYFLDKLRGLETLRLFDRKDAELINIEKSSENFRLRTMEVLRIAFLSSGVLEFFTSVSIAVMAVYFGFSYLGDLNFGHYGLPLTLFIGFFCLILAPEFYQPLRDLGTFYHAKAQAIGAADSLLSLDLDQKKDTIAKNPKDKAISDQRCDIALDEGRWNDWQCIEFINLVVKSSDGVNLTQPINFVLNRGDKVAIFGRSGSGKSSFIHCLMGFLPFEGTIKVDGTEMDERLLAVFRKNIHWLAQNPILPGHTIRDNLNVVTTTPKDNETLWAALKKAQAEAFVQQLPHQLDTPIGENATRLSVGQAQRIALSKLFMVYRSLWILDEPTASLDKQNADLVMQSIADAIGFKGYKHNSDILTEPLMTELPVTLLLITHDEIQKSYFTKQLQFKE